MPRLERDNTSEQLGRHGQFPQVINLTNEQETTQ